MIWLILSTLSSLLSIFLWIREELNNSKFNRSKLAYPIVFILLSLIAIYQYFQLTEIKEIKTEAAVISTNWPKLEEIKFITKGERLGIILACQTFLEKHKSRFPDTYSDFQALKKGRLGDYKSKTNSSDKYAEYEDLEDVCGAAITIINNLKK
ncbi:hypothetical protein [Flavihumibacter solisilvae]|uniref:Uncharacterized protein n=1 Tax=Flavihumibacter solisilvae TaxID=1349421 RepID=A0A0C1KVC7_9BACT|nr:hypothetical protein [Flavihumibacter solisilvae]KIC91311.1 hypothetical protein OI18_22325 [Flavihumibacter solisilvae]